MLLYDTRLEQGEFSSTSTAVYDALPHTGPVTSAQYIDPLKRACLPRLARDQTVIQPAPRNLTDRLNQMRVEDRRREKNNEKRRQTGTKSSLPLPAFVATSSASARAGSLYYQSSQLAHQDMTERQQICEMQRKFAGPTPPTSWRKEIHNSAIDASAIETTGDNTPMAKKRATLALRCFVDGDPKEKGLATLSDLCLARIGSSLCIITTDDSAELDQTRETMTFFPSHLKERLMALAGREQQCKPLNTTALQTLLSDGHRGGRPLKENKSESWEIGEGTASKPVGLKVMDLSFARIGIKMLKTVLSQGADMHQLRILSLAGWGAEDGSGQKSLLSVPYLMEAIGNLPHLEVLSLAKTRLCPVSKGASSKSRDNMMLDSITFLKRLSRSSLRVKALDLSQCDWIIGPDIANLGWYSIDRLTSRSKIIWPRLEHLALVKCVAFTDSDKEEEDEDVLKPSPSYVAKWHAAHHGVALVTDSPYLLQHRPGLGNAVFRAEDAQQARLARQRRSVRQQARRDDAWGSSDDEVNEIHSPSSSAYPTRCPVSGVHVGAWEWERARVLDAVRGRWGSAIKGDISNVPSSAGSFIEVYF